MNETVSNDDRAVADGAPCAWLQIAEAWRNLPGLATLLLTFAGIALLSVLAVASASRAAGSIPGALAFALGLFGLAAAGSQFMEQAGGRPVSSVARAFAASPAIVARMLGLALVAFVGLLAFVLAAAVVLLACRLPVVGPALYVVALPFLALSGALVLAALGVAALLAVPVLWEGHSLRSALAQFCTVCARRAVPGFVDLSLLFVVVGVVALGVAAFALVGFALVDALSAALVGVERPGSALASFAAWTQGLSFADATETAVAARPAAVAVAAAAAVVPAAALVFGLALACRKSMAEIDIAAARATLGRAIVETQVKALQACDDARLALQRLRATVAQRRWGVRVAASPPAPAIAVAGGPAGAAAAPACPQCGAVAASDDAFCGNCGRRLPA